MKPEHSGVQGRILAFTVASAAPDPPFPEQLRDNGRKREGVVFKVKHLSPETTEANLPIDACQNVLKESFFCSFFM